MIRMLATAASLALGLAACASAPAVRTPGAPGFPDYPEPVVPVTLRVPQDVRDRLSLGWQHLQTGDLRGASRELNETLRRSPGFYPAETALGFVGLAGRDFKQAAARFQAALDRDKGYLPAWQGLVQAQVGLEQYDDAVTAMERLLALDPKRDRTQLEMLKLRQVQDLIERGRRARQARRSTEAAVVLSRALAMSPKSAVILRELATTEIALDELIDAEAHARHALELDGADAASHATLGAVLEARGRLADAAAAYGRAAAIDAVWRAKAESLRAAAKTAPAPELRDLDSSATITRAQLAGLTATRLESAIAGAPTRPAQVIVDIQGHWAAPWILAVTQAGVMEVFTNHTFQPAATVRRGDLAQMVSRMIPLVLNGRASELARWQAVRPSFPDLGASNLYYRAAALAVTAGTMSADETGRFEPTRLATGTEVLSAISRLEQLVKR